MSPKADQYFCYPRRHSSELINLFWNKKKSESRSGAGCIATWKRYRSRVFSVSWIFESDVSDSLILIRYACLKMRLIR